MRQLMTSVTTVPLRAILIGGMCLGIAACASPMADTDSMGIEAAKMDAAQAKADAAKSLMVMEELKAMNAKTMQASNEAAAAARSAQESADRAARIAAELEAMHSKHLRK